MAVLLGRRVGRGVADQRSRPQRDLDGQAQAGRLGRLRHRHRGGWLRPHLGPLGRGRLPLRAHASSTPSPSSTRPGRSSPTWPSRSRPTPTTRPGPSPCGPASSSTTAPPLDANALHLNLTKQASSILTGPAFAALIASSTVTGPLSVQINMKAPWVPFPYYLAQGQTGYVAAPSMLNNPNGTTHPVGTGPVRLQGVGAQQPLHRHRQPALLAQGPALPEPDHLQADHRPQRPGSTRSKPAPSTSCTPTRRNSLLTFRGNKKWSYYDNSGSIVGRTDRQLPDAQHRRPRPSTTSSCARPWPWPRTRPSTPR